MYVCKAGSSLDVGFVYTPVQCVNQSIGQLHVSKVGRGSIINSQCDT